MSIQVTSGKYHFKENVLVLQTEKKHKNSDGTFQAVKETICYEVTSLTYGNHRQPKAELIGARSEAVATPLFNHLIQTLMQMKDASAVLGDLTNKDHEIPLGKRALRQEGTKTISIQRKVEKGSSSPYVVMNVASHYFSPDGQRIALDPEAAPKQMDVNHFKDSSLLEGLLASPHWRALVGATSNSAGHERVWSLTSQRAKEFEAEFEQLSELLLKPGEPNSKQSFVSTLKGQIELMKKQQRRVEPIISTLNAILKTLEEKKNKVMENIPLDPDEELLMRNDAYRIYAHSIREIKEALDVAKSLHAHLENKIGSNEQILLLVNTRHLEQQFAAKGRAPFGETLSMDWFRCLDDAGLFDLDEINLRALREALHAPQNTAITKTIEEAKKGYDVALDLEVDSEINLPLLSDYRLESGRCDYFDDESEAGF